MIDAFIFDSCLTKFIVGSFRAKLLTLFTLSMCSRNSADFTGHLEAIIEKMKTFRRHSEQTDITEISSIVVILGIICHEWCMVVIIILWDKQTQKFIPQKDTQYEFSNLP